MIEKNINSIKFGIGINLLVFCQLAMAQGEGLISGDTVHENVLKFAGVPVFNYSTTLGFSFGALGQLFYNINKLDTISPASSTGVFGMYTTNGSYFVGGFQQFYLQEDNWRILLAGGKGKINFQYWQWLPVIDGIFIGFGTEAVVGMMKIERRLYHDLYGGVIGMISKTTTAFDLPEIVPDSLKIDKRSMNNIGYQFNYDKREHIINPYGGFNIIFKNHFYREWLGSGNDFQKLQLSYNHYYRIKNNRNILATRFRACLSNGDVPFQGENVVGMDDIRGYSKGKYRNNQVYTVQSEYRWRFYKKLGMVGFFGFATAVEHFEEIFNSEILPGGGIGLRYMMISSERINVGFDVALGKDDWGLYFRIGESFGR